MSWQERTVSLTVPDGEQGACNLTFITIMEFLGARGTDLQVCSGEV